MPRVYSGVAVLSKPPGDESTWLHQACPTSGALGRIAHRLEAGPALDLWSLCIHKGGDTLAGNPCQRRPVLPRTRQIPFSDTVKKCPRKPQGRRDHIAVRRGNASGTDFLDYTSLRWTCARVDPCQQVKNNGVAVCLACQRRCAAQVSAIPCFLCVLGASVVRGALWRPFSPSRSEGFFHGPRREQIVRSTADSSPRESGWTYAKKPGPASTRTKMGIRRSSSQAPPGIEIPGLFE